MKQAICQFCDKDLGTKVPDDAKQVTCFECDNKISVEDQKRIADIDAMFKDSNSWGSWMVEAANDREALANKYNLPHRYQARSGTGGRVS